MDFLEKPQDTAEQNTVTETVDTSASQVNQPKDISFTQYDPEEIVKFAKLYEEFTSDPYSFLARYVPEVFPRDDYSWVSNALKREFGEDFTPDPNEALIPGTKSNLYLLRQQQLIMDYQRSLQEKMLEEQRRRQEFQERFNQEKQELMKKYSLDENAFNTFWSELEKTPITLESLYKALYFDRIVEKIKQEVAEEIKKQLQNTPPPSPAQVNSTEQAVDKDLADFGFIIRR